jgi:hypothetical protein
MSKSELVEAIKKKTAGSAAAERGGGYWGLGRYRLGIPKPMVASTTTGQLRKLDVADRNGCDDQTMQALRAIPLETYTNVAQVAASVTIADGRNVGDGDKAAARRTR